MALATTLSPLVAGAAPAADHERARQAVEAGEAKPLGDILAVIADQQGHLSIGSSGWATAPITAGPGGPPADLEHLARAGVGGDVADRAVV